jgi:hypothetical protein
MLLNGTLQNGTQTLQYSMLNNSTLQSQKGLHQPMDWLALGPTFPNHRYGQSQSTEVHQPLG